MIIERYQMVDKEFPTPDLTELFASIAVAFIGLFASVAWFFHTFMWVVWFIARKIFNLDEKNRDLALSKEWDDVKKEERHVD